MCKCPSAFNLSSLNGKWTLDGGGLVNCIKVTYLQVNCQKLGALNDSFDVVTFNGTSLTFNNEPFRIPTIVSESSENIVVDWGSDGFGRNWRKGNFSLY